MAHVREQRPASAAHVLRRLEELMASGGITPRRAPPRRMMWMTAASIVVLTAAALGVAGLPQLRDQWQSVELGATRQLTNVPGLELDPSLSRPCGPPMDG